MGSRAVPCGAQLIRQAPSPNFGPRREGLAPRYIVLHYTAMASAAAAEERLSDPAFEVSAHYLLARSGAVTQLVAEEMRAWHAGAGSWRGQADMNSRSIGIELANTGHEPYPSAQISALITLMREIMGRWEIPPARVIGHSDMAPGRKIDPGRRFPWAALEAAGVALGQCGRCETAASLSALGEQIGYPEAAPDVILETFRSRFAQGRLGPPRPADLEEMAWLAQTLDALDPRGGGA